MVPTNQLKWCTSRSLLTSPGFVVRAAEHVQTGLRGRRANRDQSRAAAGKGEAAGAKLYVDEPGSDEVRTLVERASSGDHITGRLSGTARGVRTKAPGTRASPQGFHGSQECVRSRLGAHRRHRRHACNMPGGRGPGRATPATRVRQRAPGVVRRRHAKRQRRPGAILELRRPTEPRCARRRARRALQITAGTTSRNGGEGGVRCTCAPSLEGRDLLPKDQRLRFATVSAVVLETGRACSGSASWIF